MKISFTKKEISFIAGRVECNFDSETPEEEKLQDSIERKIGKAYAKRKMYQGNKKE